MFAILALMLYGFGWGLRRGASFCMALCVPAIMPKLAEGGGSWKTGARVALIYNAPRMAMLTLLGAAIGATGFAARSVADSMGFGEDVWSLGYMVAGALMLVYGAYAFARATDSLEDIAEGKCSEGPKHPILSRLGVASPKTDSGLLLWGAVVSIACIGETAIAMEGALAGYASGAESTSAFGGALIGAATFFMFSLGAALPAVVIGAAGSSALGEEERGKRLARIQQIAAGLMLAIGLMFLLTSAFRLL